MDSNTFYTDTKKLHYRGYEETDASSWGERSMGKIFIREQRRTWSGAFHQKNTLVISVARKISQTAKYVSIHIPK